MQNFKHNSPFADMIPSFSDFFYHPITSGRTIVEVIRLGEAHNAAIVQEKRRRRVDDVVKRSQYRKAHGLEDKQGFGGWTAKTDAEMVGPALHGDEVVVPAHAGDGSESPQSAQSPQNPQNPQELKRKWLGIF